MNYSTQPTTTPEISSTQPQVPMSDPGNQKPTAGEKKQGHITERAAAMKDAWKPLKFVWKIFLKPEFGQDELEISLMHACVSLRAVEKGNWMAGVNN
ncbi:hypothetical protein BDZ91DRAFT_851756 [Kalaharituber pfeilii]|nr:hypothetical protein BDZ91DRAFT_851756 [Kalaharituber pfeilii]